MKEPITMKATIEWNKNLKLYNINADVFINEERKLKIREQVCKETPGYEGGDIRQVFTHWLTQFSRVMENPTGGNKKEMIKMGWLDNNKETK